MKKRTLAITIRSFDPDGSLRQQLDPFFEILYINSNGIRLGECEVSDAIQNAEAVIAGTEPFSRRTIQSAHKLKFISRVGVGLDTIDLEAAKEHNIRVLIAQLSTVQPVAEHTVALIMSTTKRINEYNAAIRSSDFSVKATSILQGKPVGIVGLGRIGFRVGELLTGFGCCIHFYDPFLNRATSPGWQRENSFEDLISKVDIITLHVPAQKDNMPLFNEESFNHCRDGVIIINTARGSLIDEDALSDALKRGKVASAGLDVFANEPYTGPLLLFPQVIVTPHVASNTIESRKNMEREAVTNLIAAIKEIRS
nr:NAD(P)-dependent oxidoreductase [uncultured Methanoregula sp.]